MIDSMILDDNATHSRDFSHELAAFLFKTSCVNLYNII